MAKKKNLVGAKLNFYFYLIFFNFLEKKIYISQLIIFYFFLGNWGGPGPLLAPPPSVPRSGHLFDQFSIVLSFYYTVFGCYGLL
jgi:hypothetical protein